MKRILFLFTAFTFLIGTEGIHAQGNTCPGTPFCTAVGTPFNYTNVSNGSAASGAASWGCLGSEPNPSWFYIKTTGAGAMTFNLGQGTTIGANNLDVDFIAYGPFTTATFNSGTVCNDLTGGCGGDHNCSGNIADCSFSASATESMTLNSPGAGYYYIILITNYNGGAGFITFTQTGGPGTDCSITCNPTTLSLLAQDTTNYFAGNATYMPNGATAQCTLPFFVWPNQPTFTDPSTDLWTPCIMADFNPFNTNENTNGIMSVYEGGVPTYSLCNTCPQGSIGGSVGVTGNDFNEFLGYLDSTQAHVFTFCNTSTVGSTVVSLKNCWDGTVYAGPVTWNTTSASCFTLTVPANTDIGSAVYSITPASGGTGVYVYSSIPYWHFLHNPRNVLSNRKYIFIFGKSQSKNYSNNQRKDSDGTK